MIVASTCDGTNIKLFINSELIKSVNPTGGLYPPLKKFISSRSGSGSLNGNITRHVSPPDKTGDSIAISDVIRHGG
jgi:hypothetical protein